MNSKKFKYVYGPVPSRRLGRSLGVNPIPLKTCNYSCVYCQLGRTLHLINERQKFFPKEDILDEIIEAVSLNRNKIDFITFVGEGEPTLYSGIGDLIKMIQDYTPMPLAVITNGALFYDSDVRRALKSSSVLLPTLDAPDEKKWKLINRPHPDLKFDTVLDGLFQMREEMKGEMWLEVMLMKGINDDDDTLYRLGEIIKDLKPHRVYINVPIRPPAEPWVEVPDDDTLRKATKILGAIPLGSVEEGTFYVKDDEDPFIAILNIIKRHPMRRKQIEKVAQEHGWNKDSLIESLRKSDLVEVVSSHGTEFFRYRLS